MGIAQYLTRRLAEHNSGKSKFTSAHVPWLVLYTELVNSTQEARDKEKYLKSAAEKRFINKILGAGFPTDIGQAGIPTLGTEADKSIKLFGCPLFSCPELFENKIFFHTSNVHFK